MGSMLFNTNKERGNTGLALAIAYFGANGATVSVPLNDTQDYDILIDIDGIIKKVQVKFTSYKEKSGNYSCRLTSSGGTRGIVYKRVIDTDIDLLFIVCSNKDMYLIPKSVITQRTTINLCSKTEQYKVEI